MTDHKQPSAEIAARAAQLRAELNEHNYRYHVLNEPIISDAEFDALLEELRRLEALYPALRTPDSPTQRVGAPPAEGFAKVTHPQPVLSLSNAFHAGDVRGLARTSDPAHRTNLPQPHRGARPTG